MTWVNFREIQGRFTHIDAQFVSSSVRLGTAGSEAMFTVRFYPWWEHPLYRAARDAGQPWGFEDVDEGAREVTVKAINAVAVRFHCDSEVSDWAFLSEHPLLWDFAPESVVYANAPFQVGELIDRLVARGLPFVERPDLFPYLDPSWSPVSSRGIALPPQLHRPVLEELAAMDVPVFAPRPAPDGPELVLFLIDGRDYIIADDFIVDVPEFRHEAKWFRPSSGGNAG